MAFVGRNSTDTSAGSPSMCYAYSFDESVRLVASGIGMTGLDWAFRRYRSTWSASVSSATRPNVSLRILDVFHLMASRMSLLGPGTVPQVVQSSLVTDFESPLLSV